MSLVRQQQQKSVEFQLVCLNVYLLVPRAPKGRPKLKADTSPRTGLYLHFNWSLHTHQLDITHTTSSQLFV